MNALILGVGTARTAMLPVAMVPWREVYSGRKVLLGRPRAIVVALAFDSKIVVRRTGA